MLSILISLALLGGCGKKDTLRTMDRIALRDSVSAEATLAVDAASHAWIGAPGALVAVDTAGREVARVPVSLAGTPRLLWTAAGRRYVRTEGASAVLDAAGK
ncbi:MAG TPA: hypothetical protein VF541_16250, partial [Longimicrobium sp.]